MRKKKEFISGDYFESPEWHEKYTAYLNEHTFERPVVSDMKKDLLKRFRRREGRTAPSTKEQRECWISATAGKSLCLSHSR